MIWILIWSLNVGPGVASHSQEFNNKAACEAAKEEIKELAYRVESVCVPKGAKK